jgi:hypothetical protein
MGLGFKGSGFRLKSHKISEQEAMINKNAYTHTQTL